MRSSPLILAAALACSGSPEPSGAVAPPSRVVPRAFADLDTDGRREVCARVVDRVRMACDPELRDLDPPLVEQCTADHPIWACPQVTVADHERCLADRDAAACAAHQEQTEACGVRAALQQCKLVVLSVAPNSPAAAAALLPGDVLLSLNGAARSAADRDALPAILKKSASRPLRLDVVTIGHPTRTLEITGAGSPPSIGATFAPSLPCRGWTPNFAEVPCSARAAPPGP